MILAVILSSMDIGVVAVLLGMMLALAANQNRLTTHGTNTMWIECLIGRAAISARADNVLGVS